MAVFLAKAFGLHWAGNPRHKIRFQRRSTMSRRFAWILFLFLAPGAVSRASGQSAGNAWEADIRAAEANHVQAFLAGNVAEIDKMLSNEFVVNSPLNNVVDKKQLVGMVRTGLLTLSDFTQDIERITRFGDVVFVMGSDKVVWAKPSPNAGRTDRRRFTDVWRLENGRWVFIARQATVLCP
jgi:hypothetical protein